MSKSVLILETPSCCELCRFIDYEPKCHCRMLSYKEAKIEDRFAKLDNCPLRELPEKYSVMELDSMQDYERARAEGYNYCIEGIVN